MKTLMLCKSKKLNILRNLNSSVIILGLYMSCSGKKIV